MELGPTSMVIAVIAGGLIFVPVVLTLGTGVLTDPLGGAEAFPPSLVPYYLAALVLALVSFFMGRHVAHTQGIMSGKVSMFLSVAVFVGFLFMLFVFRDSIVGAFQTFFKL